jgi:hypothetical protein
MENGEVQIMHGRRGSRETRYLSENFGIGLLVTFGALESKRGMLETLRVVNMEVPHHHLTTSMPSQIE